MMKQRKNESLKNVFGFTLIELMIVVAIIGILAAIAIPNFRNYQLKAKRNELPLNLKAIRTAEISFQAEKHHFQQLAPTPIGTATSKKRKWLDQGGFSNIGFTPTGEVYGTYKTTGSLTATTMIGSAHSDIDNNGINASYEFTANITNPYYSANPRLTSDLDSF